MTLGNAASYHTIPSVPTPLTSALKFIAKFKIVVFIKNQLDIIIRY